MSRSLANPTGLTLFELLVVVCIIFVFLGLFAVYANIILKVGREEALRNELMNLRMSLEHYRAIYSCYPEDLNQLLNKGLTASGLDSRIGVRKFLRSFRLDKEGYLLDPFMHRYGYNDKEGIIYSQTRGYERW